MLYRWEGKGANKEVRFPRSQLMAMLQIDDWNQALFQQEGSCALISLIHWCWLLVPLCPSHVKHMWAQLFLIILTGVVAQLVTTFASSKKCKIWKEHLYWDSFSIISEAALIFFLPAETWASKLCIGWGRFLLLLGRSPGCGLCWWPSSMPRCSWCLQ